MCSPEPDILSSYTPSGVVVGHINLSMPGTSFNAAAGRVVYSTYSHLPFTQGWSVQLLVFALCTYLTN